MVIFLGNLGSWVGWNGDVFGKREKVCRVQDILLGYVDCHDESCLARWVLVNYQQRIGELIESYYIA